MSDKGRTVLITGALGQIGSELTIALRERYGNENVIATDLREDEEGRLSSSGTFSKLDVLSTEEIDTIVKKFRVNAIYHLAAMLSAVAEKAPEKAWHVNMNGLFNVLEVARENDCSVFFPSSIGVFGPSTPMDGTPQVTIQRPESMYGITKLAGELLCNYYHDKYGVDTRGVRFPGIISNVARPGGGTTDYAVEIFYDALEKGRYTCFLRSDTYLDMMYMPDAMKAAIEIMEADGEHLRFRNAYNIASMSFTPEELAAEIRKHIPGFAIDYEVDPVRQKIADSWPNYMDDSAAREDWGWKPDYDIAAMTEDMLSVLRKRIDGDAD